MNYRIAIGLPTYGKFEAAMVTGLIRLIRVNDKVSDFLITEGSVVVDTRNAIVRIAYREAPYFTHILFIDSDQSDFDASSLDKLIEVDQPIVAGVTVFRNLPAGQIKRGVTFKRIDEPPEGGVIQLADQVLEVSHTGFFFTLVKREVFDVMSEDVAGNEKVWFTTQRHPRAAFGQECEEFISTNKNTGPEALRNAIKLGLNANRGTGTVGEDVEFCHRARLLGFRSYVRCGVRLGHIGQTTYRVGDGE